MIQDEANEAPSPIDWRKIAVWKHLEFVIPSHPGWRKANAPCLPSTDRMLLDICKSLNDFVKLPMESDELEKLKEEYTIMYVQSINEGEDVGTKDYKTTQALIRNERTSSDCPTPIYDTNEKETINIYRAYKFLQEHTKSASDEEKGLLCLEMLTDTHSIILKDLSKYAGKFSTRPRFTFRPGGEMHVYPHFKTIQQAEDAVQTCLDRYNNLVAAIHQDFKKNRLEYPSISNLFKCASLLLLEIVSLHPFSDGNGRLCRLLCDYSLQSLFPFPTPIYNVHSSTKKQDYLRAVIESDKKKDPGALTAMLIECNWFTWKELNKKQRKSDEE